MKRFSVFFLFFFALLFSSPTLADGGDGDSGLDTTRTLGMKSKKDTSVVIMVQGMKCATTLSRLCSHHHQPKTFSLMHKERSLVCISLQDYVQCQHNLKVFELNQQLKRMRAHLEKERTRYNKAEKQHRKHARGLKNKIVVLQKKVITSTQKLSPSLSSSLDRLQSAIVRDVHIAIVGAIVIFLLLLFILFAVLTPLARAANGLTTSLTKYGKGAAALEKKLAKMKDVQDVMSARVGNIFEVTDASYEKRFSNKPASQKDTPPPLPSSPKSTETVEYALPEGEEEDGVNPEATTEEK